MNTLLLKKLVAVAAITSFVQLVSAAALKVGDTFPQLGGFELEGNLPALEGKVLLVDFWASWCAPCKQSFPALNELHQRFSKDGVVILGISVDEQRSSMEKFLKGTAAEFAIVRDAKQKLVAAVSVDTMPTSFIVDRKGRVRFVHSGYHGAETKRAYEKEIQEVLKEKP